MTELSLLFFSGTTLLGSGVDGIMKIQLSKSQPVNRDGLDKVDALRSAWIAEKSKPTGKYSAAAARTAYDAMDEGISELLPRISGVVDVGEADFAAYVVKALTSNITASEVPPVVVVSLLFCHSSRVTRMIVDELSKRTTDLAVQRLEGRVLLIGMLGQWPATESIRCAKLTKRGQ
jgi:hypothetical protein